jgi:uncharacterized protein
MYIRLFVFFFSLISIAHSVIASDLFQADSYFQQQQYPLAREAYLDSANVGSAHAFYQLGLMEYKGLGVPQNSVKALVWFGLAAEQKFNDSETIVNDLLALVADENKTDMMQLVNNFRQRYGVQYLSRTFFPLIKSTALNTKILFVEEGQSPQTASQFYHYIDSLDVDLDREQEWDGENEIDEDSARPTEIFARAKPVDIWNRPYSAVVDYDVAPDGSPRNLQSSQEIGHYRTAFNELVLSGGPNPQFSGARVPFINQAKLGLAGYSKFKLSSEKYQRFYYALKRKAKKLSNSKSSEDQYRYALLLMTFEWLGANENEVDVVLSKLSESGFPSAQYEYGTKLYRQQSDIPGAIYWLSEASKYGMAKAQYRLARILLDSPWVEKDQRKALFWLERAANNGHVIARLKAAELKVLASDDTLHNLESAQQDLLIVSESQSDNPEYEYVQAMLNYSVTPRKLPIAVEHLRKAISQAERLNWDATEWQSLLAHWTSGGTVTIVEP